MIYLRVSFRQIMLKKWLEMFKVLMPVKRFRIDVKDVKADSPFYVFPESTSEKAIYIQVNLSDFMEGQVEYVS